MRTKKITPTIDQLSANERTVLEYLQGHPSTRRRGPTLRQISAGTGVPLTTTYDVVLRLEGYGFLERKGRRRSITLKGADNGYPQATTPGAVFWQAVWNDNEQPRKVRRLPG